MVALLSGFLSPIGWSVGWIEAPLPDAVATLLTWRGDLGADLEVEALSRGWPHCLQHLDPLEAPWTCELLAGHGGTWTCYLNNDLNGGDPFPATSYVARLLETRAVISTHQPVTAAGHASTQFELIGPDGEPPLMYQRTIAAHAEDGRRSWHESGEPLPFEHPERYAARLTRARFDRALLTEYLAAMAIHVDDDAAYTGATFIRQRVSCKTRKQTLGRGENMLDRQR